VYGVTFGKDYCIISMDMTLAIKPHRTRRPHAGPQSGFLLIELLVALAILGIIAVAFLSALTTGYRGLLLAHEMTMAESLVRTELERIRDAPYPIAGEVKSHRGYDISITTSYVEPTPDPRDPVATTYVPSSAPTGMQNITVSITHQGKVVLVTGTNKADG